MGTEVGNTYRLASSSYVSISITLHKQSCIVSGQAQPENHIPVNKDEIPILPTNLDFNRASMGELVQILQDYYLALWGMSLSRFLSI